MRLISVTPEEPGVFAVGQFAYGFFAFGQMATGVIAIGQIARGLVAVGQVGFGLVAVGQVAFGSFAGAGLGLFGRGWPFSLVPSLPRPRALPPTTDASQVRMGYGDGWIEAELGLTPSGVPCLAKAARPLDDIKLSARLVPLVRAELGRYERPKVIAHLRRAGDTLVCDRLLHVPVPLSERRNFRASMTARMVTLVLLAIAVWIVIWPPIAAL
jgi:hypothetical protein